MPNFIIDKLAEKKKRIIPNNFHKVTKQNLVQGPSGNRDDPLIQH